MAPNKSHKYYIFMLVVAAIFSFGAILDFDACRKVEHYNPQGIAHYDLPYDTFPPTARLLRSLFLGAIENFPNRDTIVLIGNSVIAGAGAKDKLFFSSSLLDGGYNVINAALGGEYLSASSALAVLGIATNHSSNPVAFHSIFVVYPPSRVYEMGSYWVTGPALISLAKERNLSSYIMPYSPTAKENNNRVSSGLEVLLHENMRCIVTRHDVVRAVTSFNFNCEKPFSTENNNPEFLKIYARGLEPPHTKQEYEALSGFDIFIDDESQRTGKVNSIVAQLRPLESFLLQHQVPHQMYFLLLRDAPVALGTLSSQRRIKYDLGRTAFLKELSEKTPSWKVLEAPPLENSDFFDTAHLRESGQAKIATLITHVIAENKVLKR